MHTQLSAPPAGVTWCSDTCCTAAMLLLLLLLCRENKFADSVEAYIPIV
jgi:hypothetical protein